MIIGIPLSKLIRKIKPNKIPRGTEVGIRIKQYKKAFVMVF
ncbi:hypothetical protein [Staphylococcus saccharolyticus]|nr:hypothetical protein [Staphylococcus saccharolyticus]